MGKRILSILTAVVCMVSTLPQVMAEPLEEPKAIGNYGLTLASIYITDTISSVAGVWSWTDPTIKPNAGTSEYEATFTPNDTNNYNSVTVMIPVTTLPATPQITVNSTSTELVYGEKLENATLSGGIAFGPIRLILQL